MQLVPESWEQIILISSVEPPLHTYRYVMGISETFLNSNLHFYVKCLPASPMQGGPPTTISSIDVAVTVVN